MAAPVAPAARIEARDMSDDKNDSPVANRVGTDDGKGRPMVARKDMLKQTIAQVKALASTQVL